MAVGRRVAVVGWATLFALLAPAAVVGQAPVLPDVSAAHPGPAGAAAALVVPSAPVHEPSSRALPAVWTPLSVRTSPSRSEATDVAIPDLAPLPRSGRGALRGILIGGAAGAGVGLLMGTACDGGECPRDRDVMLVTVGIGVLIGGVLGALAS